MDWYATGLPAYQPDRRAGRWPFERCVHALAAGDALPDAGQQVFSAGGPRGGGPVAYALRCMNNSNTHKSSRPVSMECKGLLPDAPRWTDRRHGPRS